MFRPGQITQFLACLTESGYAEHEIQKGQSQASRPVNILRQTQKYEFTVICPDGVEAGQVES
jgi:hypothetical protein